jgi:hypothetical protein
MHGNLKSNFINPAPQDSIEGFDTILAEIQSLENTQFNPGAFGWA